MQNNRYESNTEFIDPDLPSRRCSIEYFTFLSFVWGSDVTKLGSSGRSSITGQLNHFSPTYSDLIFSLKSDVRDGPRWFDNLWSSKFELVRVGRWFLKGVQSLFGSRIRAQLTSNNSLQFHPIEFPCFLSFYKMSDPFLIDESRIQVWRNSIPNCFVVRTRLFIDFSNASVISGRNRTPGPCQTSKGRQ